MRPRNPAFESLGDLSVRPPRGDRSERGRPRDPDHRLRDGRSAGADARPDPAGLLRRRPRSRSYPPAAGTPALRRAIADWVRPAIRRCNLDPERHVLPSNGSKEAVYLLHQAVIDPRGERRVVLIPDPAYPVYEIATALRGRASPVPVPLRDERGFLPDLDAMSAETWRRTALLWLNYPNNPTGAVAGLDLYRQALDLAERHGFWVASDEAYSELWFDAPPVSALQAGLEGLVVLNTLSKRSAMTGYRSGLIAGDPELISDAPATRPAEPGGRHPDLRRGTRRSTAWDDEAHVAEQRDLYREKRDVLLPGPRAQGARVWPGARRPSTSGSVSRAASTSEAFAPRCSSAGSSSRPATTSARGGEGYVRMALVPTLELSRRRRRSWSSVL